MKSKKRFIIPALFIILSFVLPVSAGWQVDSQLRFQLAYTPDGKVSSAETVQVSSLKLTKDYMPDIDNIILSDIQGLGFTLPGRDKSEKYKLYLKLFNFPQNLKAVDICPGVLKAFHIADMPSSGSKLVEYVSDNKSSAVKYGFIDKADRPFTEKNPYPPLLSGKESGFGKVFLKNTPFFSLYLNPDKTAKTSDKDEMARLSAQGVVDFHKELIAHYNKTLKPISGKDPQKYFYFMDEKNRTSLRILREPMVFKNWRNLPMPTDPGRHFLSGLLLIYLSADGDSDLAKETVFEVGSIVRLP